MNTEFEYKIYHFKVVNDIGLIQYTFEKSFKTEKTVYDYLKSQEGHPWLSIVCIDLIN